MRFILVRYAATGRRILTDPHRISSIWKELLTRKDTTKSRQVPLARAQEMLGGRGHSHNIQIAGQVKRAIAAIGAPAFPVLPDRPLVNTIHIRYSSKAIKHS